MTTTLLDAIHSRLLELSEGDYARVREDYETAIYGTIYQYLTTPGVRYDFAREAMKRAMTAAFIPAFWIGYTDGAGEGAEPDAEDLDWIAAKYAAEAGFIDLLFTSLRGLKQEEGVDVIGARAAVEAGARMGGYTSTLDGIYNEGKLRGAKNVMLTFVGPDGKESCETCQHWKGRRHKATFWVNRGLVPGQPGNPNFVCQGYLCQHLLETDKGEVFGI